MHSFSMEWLTLREPADTRARSARVTRAAAARLPRSRAISALDLGAGSGANVRYLTFRLRRSQRWLLADWNEKLLAIASALSPVPVTTRVVDLAQIERHGDLLAGCDLVTASALLDLVSERWLTELCALLSAAGPTVLFALSYDGRVECTPSEPQDARVVELVNRHQRTDKGFGPALGPDAADAAARLLAGAGYRVVRDRSDWHLGPDLHELQRRLIEGWASAAREVSAEEGATIDDWCARRLEHVDRGRSHIVVGHEDLAAFPR